METTTYMLPCTFTGLDAELDNCDPPADVQCVSDLGDPIPAGYTRYVTADGIFLDCSLDETDFADWFGKELAEWSV